MNRSSTLRPLLVVLALLGMVLAPLGSTHAATEIPAVQHAAAMAGDMPCCPGEPAANMDCSADCPLVALCFGGLGSIALPDSRPIDFGSPVRAVFSPGGSFALTSLAGEPPARPPKA